MITLAAMREVTGTQAVTDFVTPLLERDGEWEVVQVRRRYTRLEPPHAYWAMYRVRLRHATRAEAEEGDEFHRELWLVCRGVFDGDFWARYRDGLLAPVAGLCDPLQGQGKAVINDERQFAMWFFPIDPQLPTLQHAAAGEDVRTLLRRERALIFDSADVHLGEVSVTLERYVPEINATLRYDLDVAGKPRRLYAKVARASDGVAMDALQRELWRIAEASGGLLRVVRPRGFHPELGAALQEEAQGTAVDGDRTTVAFQQGAVAAAEALVVLHDCDIDNGVTLELDHELGRLDSVVEQFALVHPRANVQLRQLLDHVRGALRHADLEEIVPSHGDLKYDQLFRDQDGFTVIDFEYFGRGETSWDLAKFSAHAVPSMPQSWEDSNAAETARAAFLNRYLELRPDATIDRLPIYEAVHLAQRAMVLMWGQRRGWEDAAESLLALAMERLKTPAPR